MTYLNTIYSMGYNINQYLSFSRPQLQRQDTYNVADKKFHVDPPEKLRSETNRNGNHADVFNTTFLM